MSGLGEFVVSVWPADPPFGAAYTQTRPTQPHHFALLPVARLNQRETYVPTQQSKAEEASRFQGPHEDPGRPGDSRPAPQKGAGEPLRLRLPSPLAIDPPLPHARTRERPDQASGRGRVSPGSPRRLAGRGEAGGRPRPSGAARDQDRVHRGPIGRGRGPAEQGTAPDARGMEDGRFNGPPGNAPRVRVPVGDSDRPDRRDRGRDGGAASKNRRDERERVMTVLSRGFWLAGAPVRAGIIGLIRLYRVTGGLLLGGQCRFYPSCSEYAEAAIRELGWIRGLALASWRIARCNPLNAGGVDYPPRRKGRSTPSYDSVNSRLYDGVIHRGFSGARRHSRREVEAFPPQGVTIERRGQ